MNIASTYGDAGATIALEGHLDTTTAPELSAAFDEVFQNAHSVVFDLGGVEYLSSAGLRVLVASCKKITAADGRMKIVNVCADVRDVFEMTGLIDILNVE